MSATHVDIVLIASCTCVIKLILTPSIVKLKNICKIKRKIALIVVSVDRGQLYKKNFAHCEPQL